MATSKDKKENTFPFTPTRLRKITPPPKGKRKIYYDSKSSLRLSVTPTGKLVFQFQMWSKKYKRPVSQTIGRHPDITIDAAREMASELAARVTAGEDIEATRKEFSQELTIDQLIDKWWNDRGSKLKTSANKKRTYELYMQKDIGNRKISEVTPVLLQQWYNDVLKRKKVKGKGTLAPSAPNAALTVLSSAFSNAMLPSPTRLVKRKAETSRETYLDGASLADFMRAIEEDRQEYGDTTADYFTLLLYTGVRSINIRTLKKDAIKGNLLEIKSDDHKNGKVTAIPLNGMALEIINRRLDMLKKQGYIGPYLFPSTGSKTGHISHQAHAWARICKRAGISPKRVGGVTPHDLRHTAASQLAMAGCTIPEIGSQLGHKDPRSTNRYTHLTASSEAAEKMAERIQQQLEANGSKKVVNIK